MSLDKVKPGLYKVVSLKGGYGFLKKLSDLGLYPGVVVKVIASSTVGGPIRVIVKGSQFGMGRGMASKVWVEHA